MCGVGGVERNTGYSCMNALLWSGRRAEDIIVHITCGVYIERERMDRRAGAGLVSELAVVIVSKRFS